MPLQDLSGGQAITSDLSPSTPNISPSQKLCGIDQVSQEACQPSDLPCITWRAWVSRRPVVNRRDEGIARDSAPIMASIPLTLRPFPSVRDRPVYGMFLFAAATRRAKACLCNVRTGSCVAGEVATRPSRPGLPEVDWTVGDLLTIWACRACLGLDVLAPDRQ